MQVFKVVFNVHITEKRSSVAYFELHATKSGQKSKITPMLYILSFSNKKISHATQFNAQNEIMKVVMNVIMYSECKIIHLCTLDLDLALGQN